jgi:hypothetical protein
MIAVTSQIVPAAPFCIVATELSLEQTADGSMYTSQGET